MANSVSCVSVVFWGCKYQVIVYEMFFKKNPETVAFLPKLTWWGSFFLFLKCLSTNPCFKLPSGFQQSFLYGNYTIAYLFHCGLWFRFGSPNWDLWNLVPTPDGRKITPIAVIRFLLLVLCDKTLAS